MTTDQPALAVTQGEAETLDQYADRIVAKTRKHMLDRLDDDVIGSIRKSHLLFGKACAIEAVSTAMEEMQAGINAHKSIRLAATREPPTREEVAQAIHTFVISEPAFFMPGSVRRMLADAILALWGR